MPKTKKTKTKAIRTKTSEPQIVIEREDTNPGFLNRIQSDLENRNALLNLILGVLIVIVAGVLVFNYFNRSRNLGPAQTAEVPAATEVADVSKDALPGSYTVKPGDTLFTIAQKYYDDGFKYNEIVTANNMPNENSLEVGQSLTIPKLETMEVMAEATPSPTPEASVTTAAEVAMQTAPTTMVDAGTGGAINQTVWGEKISNDTYTVTAGDWLSTISGRAYGDIYAYQKIAEANNITNPDVIEPGTVLKIPRN